MITKKSKGKKSTDAQDILDVLRIPDIAKKLGVAQSTARRWSLPSHPNPIPVIRQGKFITITHRKLLSWLDTSSGPPQPERNGTRKPKLTPPAKAAQALMSTPLARKIKSISASAGTSKASVLNGTRTVSPSALSVLDTSKASVFGNTRTINPPALSLPKGLKINTRLKMDGLKLLAKLPLASIPVAFFDPQHRGVLDKLGYGNEGKNRGQRRGALTQMSEQIIHEFVSSIDRTLIPSGHLFLWVDKFHLCSGFREWLNGTELDVVDLINWDKARIGMGYRSRRTSEYCLVLQKKPRKAKGVWKNHTIPDTWREKLTKDVGGHPHKKPINLQGALIEAVTNEGDIVIDPAAGDFTVMKAANLRGRNFIGCDLNG